MVDVSNLHRQVLHRSANVGKLKVDSAIEYLRECVPFHHARTTDTGNCTDCPLAD
jgi:molybdopterin/thiamine biosynthesis adenylyltransferase